MNSVASAVKQAVGGQPKRKQGTKEAFSPLDRLRMLEAEVAALRKRQARNITTDDFPKFMNKAFTEKEKYLKTMLQDINSILKLLVDEGVITQGQRNEAIEKGRE